MTIFKVTMERTYSITERQEIEIEATTAEEAKSEAYALCEEGADDDAWYEWEAGDTSTSDPMPVKAEAFVDGSENIDAGDENSASPP